MFSRDLPGFVKNPLDAFLQPFSSRLLSSNDHLQGLFDRCSVRITSLHESDTGPGRVYDLGSLVVSVDSCFACLCMVDQFCNVSDGDTG